MHKNAITAFGCLSLVAALAACSATGSSGSGEGLTFVSYGPGTYQDAQISAYVTPFEKDNDIRITIDGPSDPAKVKAMVDAKNVQWDVVDVDGVTAMQGCGTVYEPIELGDVEGSFLEGTQSECGVPDALFGLLTMYNSEVYGGNGPTTLADFFDTKKFPGKRVVYTGYPGVGQLEAALIADGVGKDEVYPLDVDRALAKYDTIRDDLVFADSYSSQQQMMADGQADMGMVVSARAYSLLKAGSTNWKPMWDTVPVSWDVLAIPKGSENKELAEKLITYASQPEQAAKFAELSGAGAANTEAKPELDELAKQVDVFGEHPETQLVIDAEWWTENIEEVTNTWQTWLNR